MTTPRAIARLAAIRGFAWGDEVDASTDGDTPVLASNGAELGHVEALAPTCDEGSSEAEAFNLFDIIDPLTDAQRTTLFEQLEKAELAALASILRAADFDLVEAVAEHLRTSEDTVRTWLPNPMPQLLDAARRARVELLDDLRSRYRASEELSLPTGAPPRLEQVRALRARLFGDSVRLAVVLAAKHRRHLSFESALLAACRGLMIAMDRFDPKRGNKFSTYGVWWIRQAVGRERMNRANALRVPVHASAGLSLLFRRERELWSATGARPELETLLEAVELSQRSGDIHLEQARPVLRAYVCGEEHIFPAIAEVLSDPSVLPPFEGGETATWIAPALEEVEQVLSGIRAKQAERMAEILRSRLRLGLARQPTLQELGDQFGITRERIRQLESKGLTSLKALKISGISADLRPWDLRGPS